MGSRWRIRRFRTGRSPNTAERRIRARPSVNAHPDVVRARESAASRLAWRNNRQRSFPRAPRAPDEPSATLEWSLDGTPFSRSSSSTTPSGPARPFRLARVTRPGMTNTDVRLGTSTRETRPDKALPPLGALPRARCRGPTRTHTPMPMTTERWVCRHACASNARPTASSSLRYVTVQDGRVALTNAERQARYRERRKAGESRIRYRRPADRSRGHSSGTTPCRRSWSCRNSTGSGGTRCRNRWPAPRLRSCPSRSAIWICRYWRGCRAAQRLRA